jgi:hypothetical protein
MPEFINALSKTITHEFAECHIPDSLTREEGSVDQVVKHPRQTIPHGFTRMTYYDESPFFSRSPDSTISISLLISHELCLPCLNIQLRRSSRRTSKSRCSNYLKNLLQCPLHPGSFPKRSPPIPKTRPKTQTMSLKANLCSYLMILTSIMSCHDRS